MASPGTTKTMSSRLLTMKFMQRAAASSPSSAPSTPLPNDQSNKRRKVSHDATPLQNVDTLVNQAAVQAAIAEEEKKVESALLKRAEELGDARWVLDVPEQTKGHTAPTPLNVIQVGFAQIDSPDGVGNESDSAGALSDSITAVRRYNMDKKKTSRKSQNNSSESSSDYESDSDSGSASLSEDMPGRQSFGTNFQSTSTTQSTSRKIPKGKKSAEQLKAIQFAEKRRKKEVKLNNPKAGIISISSGGGPSPRPPTVKSPATGKHAEKQSTALSKCIASFD
ncbi:hypothetical protein EKO27_g4319 [Xylaria grammica]|uniref:Uncharacterized protein n=1 Tax=Xylaria grammica TaxID=363999 RepID=A0A439D8R9_9PEZI|nr:hypothetical protein EKO27_g4319 [Xylaria grammica]